MEAEQLAALRVDASLESAHDEPLRRSPAQELCISMRTQRDGELDQKRLAPRRQHGGERRDDAMKVFDLDARLVQCEILKD